MKNHAKKKKAKACQCGKEMTPDDAEFWGECKACRKSLPIQSAQFGDGHDSGAASDREFHGGRFHDGEW
jgi:hypothetical protein